MATSAWISAMRLPSQAYIFIPLLAGQWLAYQIHGHFDWRIAILIHLIGLTDQLFIVFANDCADYRSDRTNKTYTLFSGGSRVLVEGRLQLTSLLYAARWMAFATMFLACVLGIFFDRWLSVVFMAIALALLWMYSFPPVRASYRGGGEILQVLGVGLLLPTFAYYAQSATLEGFPFLWFLLPVLPVQLACAISTSLADHPSDHYCNKRTFTVLVGQHKAQGTVLFLHGLSLALLLLSYKAHGVDHYGWILPFALFITMCRFFGSQPGQKQMTWLTALSIANTLAITILAALIG